MKSTSSLLSSTSTSTVIKIKIFQKRLRSVWQLQKYRFGSSANVSIVKRALVKKEFIEIEKRQTIIPDPVMAVWLKRELGLNL